MVPDKRTITAGCGLIAAAALALAACARVGYGGGDEPNEPAPALADATGASGPGATPADRAAGKAGKAGNAGNAGNAVAADLTTELRSSRIERMGKVVVNQDGQTLYLFTKDSKDPSRSTCDGTCAKIWPPAVTDGNPTVEGVAADLVGTVTREDGTNQVTIGGWPVYTYYGDKKPGAWTGQGVGGTWFVMGPSGKRNITCLPTVTPEPVAPPVDDGGYSY